METTNTPDHTADPSSEKMNTGKIMYGRGFRRGFAIAINQPEKIEEVLKTLSTTNSYDIGVRKGIETILRQKEMGIVHIGRREKQQGKEQSR